MASIDKIIKELEKNPGKEEKTSLLEEFKKELKKYESGDLKQFKSTSIYNCLRCYYDFYSKDLSSQTS